jgi:hypothetical protein
MKSGNAYCLIAVIILTVAVGAMFFVNRSNQITGQVSSQLGNLTAGVDTYISCTWSNDALDVSFGTGLSQGATLDAVGNNLSVGLGTLYNTTVDDLTNVDIELNIRGTDMISGANIIGVSNVTWASDPDSNNAAGMIVGNSIPLTTSYDTVNPVMSGVTRGAVAHYRFWLSVPGNQIAGAYVGNYTQQCVEV